MNKIQDSESYKALLKGIENGNHEAMGLALVELSNLWTKPKGVKERVVSDFWDSLVNGVTSYKYPADIVWNLARNLISESERLEMEGYAELFGALYRYDDVPGRTADDAEKREKIDRHIKHQVISLGAKIAEMVTDKSALRAAHNEKFIKTAEKALLFSLKHGGPETKLVAIDALAHFKGSELKVMLDGLISNDDIITRQHIRDTIDVMRARELYERIQHNHEILLANYHDITSAERFIIDVVYESVKTLLSEDNRREINDTIETATATGQLIHLLDLSENWRSKLFASKVVHEYEKALHGDIIMGDIKDTLLHVVKRGSKEDFRESAANALAKNGDKRVIDIFDKIVRRGEPGSDFARKSIPPAPKKDTAKKKAVR